MIEKVQSTQVKGNRFAGRRRSNGLHRIKGGLEGIQVSGLRSSLDGEFRERKIDGSIEGAFGPSIAYMITAGIRRGIGSEALTQISGVREDCPQMASGRGKK